MITALRISRWLMVSLLVLVLLSLLLLYAAPGIGLAFARHWYAQQGEGYELSASGWSFAPFNSDFRLSGLVLKHPGVGSGESRINELLFSVNPYALLDRRIEVGRVRVAGVAVTPLLAEHEGRQQLSIAGLDIPLTADDKASSQPPNQAGQDNVAAESSHVVPWQFVIRSLELDNQQLGWSVTLPAADSRGELELQTLHLTDINSDNRPVQVSVALSVLQSELTLAAPEGGAETSLNLGEADSDAPLQITLQGQLLEPLTNPQWQGDLLLNDLALSTSANQGISVRLAELVLQGMDANASQQAIEQITLADLAVEQGGQPLMNLSQYRINGVSYQDNDVSVGDQSYQGLVVHTPDLNPASDNRTKDESAGKSVASKVQEGNTPEGSDIQPQTEAIDSSDSSAESVRQVLAFVLSGLHQGEQTGEILLRDSSVTPPMTATLTLHEVDVGALDGQLEQNLQLNKPISLHLLAGLDSYNRIALDGDLSLFERDGQLFPQGQVQASISQLDLVQFNGYLGKAMGYHVERGMLNLEADIRFDQAKLSGEVKILLRNARFVPADDAAIERLSKQISMPVDTALDLLRDDNGNVRLTIPLSGDLSDPNVGLEDLTRQLSKLALRQGAMYYLRQSLQPYTTMLTVASYAGDYLFAIRLDDLVFAAQSSELTEEHAAHLQKVAEIMQGKTRLELQVCPFVSKAEATQQGDNWPQLAKARGAAVKAWLAAINDEQGNSLAQRVSLCKPQQGDTGSVVLGVE